MKLDAMTTNDACTFASAVFIVAGLTPMFLPTMIVASKLPVLWWCKVGIWLRELKPKNEKAPDNS